MSSDSSDEENLDLLKEAQDAQFISDSMFSDSPGTSTVVCQKKPLPSLRRTRNEESQFDLKVTPEFRSYVAKQLSNILDRKLNNKFADLQLQRSEIFHKEEEEAGVKLLFDSECFLEEYDENIAENKVSVSHNTKAKKAKNRNNSKVSEDLLKEVAVSTEDILSKKEVRNWSNRSKAPVFRYKRTKNGQLKLVEPEFK